MRVSVVMAVHNAERHVGQAIDSILAQTFRDFELIIVDDESADRTADIVNRFSDSRVRYVPAGRHLGLPGALNLGMSLASGELIARHDHDDVSDPRRFEKQVQFLRAHPASALVGSRAWLIDERGERVGRLDRCLDDVSVRWYHVLDNSFVHSSVMFRQSVVWEELGGYDASLVSSEDYELWARVLQRYAAANLPDRLLLYRLSPVSKMAADEDAWEKGPFPEILRSLVRRHIETMFGDIASDDELRLMGGFVLGVPARDADRFLNVFWRLCSAYERRFPAALQSVDFQRTVARQVDTFAARLRPFSRRAAMRAYRQALVARPSLATSLPWWRAAGRLTLGASGRAGLARLRRQPRAFSLAA